MKRLVLISALLALVLAPASPADVVAPPAPSIISHSFGRQDAAGAYMPLTISVVVSSAGLGFSLSSVDPVTNERREYGAIMPRHITPLADGSARVELTIPSVPKLDAVYDVFSTSTVPYLDGPIGFVTSFYAMDPAVHRSLTVRHHGDTISVRAALGARSAGPAHFRATVALERFDHGSWQPGRHITTAGALRAGSGATTPVRVDFHLRRALRSLLRSARWRIVLSYRFATDRYQFIAQGKTTRAVPAAT